MFSKKSGFEKFKVSSQPFLRDCFDGYASLLLMNEFLTCYKCDTGVQKGQAPTCQVKHLITDGVFMTFRDKNKDTLMPPTRVHDLQFQVKIPSSLPSSRFLSKELRQLMQKWCIKHFGKCSHLCIHWPWNSEVPDRNTMKQLIA